MLHYDTRYVVDVAAVEMHGITRNKDHAFLIF